MLQFSRISCDRELFRNFSVYNSALSLRDFAFWERSWRGFMQSLATRFGQSFSPSFHLPREFMSQPWCSYNRDLMYNKFLSRLESGSREQMRSMRILMQWRQKSLLRNEQPSLLYLIIIWNRVRSYSLEKSQKKTEQAQNRL